MTHYPVRDSYVPKPPASVLLPTARVRREL